jgi:cytochrome P450
LTEYSLAGSDTTAISLRSIFYYIIKSPETYEKVLQEIDEANQKGMLSEFVTYAECLNLPYL